MLPASTLPNNRLGGRPGNAAAHGQAGLTTGAVLAFLAGHVALAVILSGVPIAGTLWVAIVCSLAIVWATTGPDPSRAVYAAVYIAGSDVLWRMTGASPLWEFGKYAMAGILLLRLIRDRTLPPRWTPALYFLLLVPSTFLTWSNLDFLAARQAISFNLSGPFTLAVAALVLSTIRSDRLNVERVGLALVGPAVAVYTLSFLGMRSAGSIAFGDESNFQASGGFGPNQVSALLGAGALLALLLAYHRGGRRYLYAGIALLLGTQALLTFSRGGVLNLALASLAFSIHLARNRVHRRRLIAASVPILLLAWFVVMPAIDDFTKGQWRGRYSNLDTASRGELYASDLEVFREHPILGVGPGMTSAYRRSTRFVGVAAHTEFTRMLAEHGTPGLLALLMLIGMSLRAYLRAPSTLSRAWVAGLIVWSFAQMGHSAMRIAMGPLLFGLAMLAWPAPESPPARERD